MALGLLLSGNKCVSCLLKTKSGLNSICVPSESASHEQLGLVNYMLIVMRVLKGTQVGRRDMSHKAGDTRIMWEKLRQSYLVKCAY